MKKILAILLSLIMTVGLCACGNKNTDEQRNNDTKVETSETEKDKENLEKESNNTYDENSIFGVIDKIGKIEKPELTINNYGVQLSINQLSIESLCSDFKLDFDLYNLENITLTEALSNMEYKTDYDLEIHPYTSNGSEGLPLEIINPSENGSDCTIKEIVDNNSWNLFTPYSSKLEKILGLNDVFSSNMQDLGFLEKFGTPDKIYCVGAMNVDDYKQEITTPKDYVNCKKGFVNLSYLLVYDYGDYKFVVGIYEMLKDGKVLENHDDSEFFMICNNKYFEEELYNWTEKVEFWNIEDGFLLD